MAAFHGFVGILLMLTTCHAYPQFRMPFYKHVQDSPVRLMAMPREGGSGEHRTHANNYNAIPVTLGGRKYIMMNVDDSDSDRNENVYHQSGNTNPQSSPFVRYQPLQNMFWNKNQENNNNNKNDGSKNLLFYKGDDGKFLPIQRNRFTDWIYGLFTKFQKTPAKKDPEPETSEVNIIHPPVVAQPPPAFSYDNVYSSPQNYAPFPSNGYPYPYPYYPNFQYGQNFNPYPGKPNRVVRPPGFVNKDPTLQQFGSPAGGSDADFLPDGSSNSNYPPVGSSNANYPPAGISNANYPPAGSSHSNYPPAGNSNANYSPYPPFKVPEKNTEPAEESIEEELEEEPEELDARQRTFYVMPPSSRESQEGFIW